MPVHKHSHTQSYTSLSGGGAFCGDVQMHWPAGDGAESSSGALEGFRCRTFPLHPSCVDTL